MNLQPFGYKSNALTPRLPCRTEYLAIKCWLHYLPREFSLVIVTAVYIPPEANTTAALKELHGTLYTLETPYPEATFIVAMDFNKANLRKMQSKFYQHIDCGTRFGKTLERCYSTFRDAYS